MPSGLVMAIAHRGASAHAPENTLAAFEQAIDSGARAIEFDVRVTKDGIPVVMHDETVERTTNGRGGVSEMTCSDLQQLDAGSWMDKRFSGLKVPTLQEAIATISAAAMPVIELKSALDAPVLEEILKRYGCLSKTVVISFEERWLGPIKRQNRDFRIGLLSEDWPVGLVERAVGLGAEVLAINVGVMQLDRIIEAQAAGLELWCYTANDIGLVAACAAMGARGIITDRPELVRETPKARE